MAKKTIYSVYKSKVPTEQKVAFYKKEERAGKLKVFKAQKELKNALQTPTATLPEVGIIAKRVNKARAKMGRGQSQVLFARKNIAMLKSKNRMVKKKRNKR